MVGKFLLGMVSGGLLVTGGLVVGSALFPARPANDNSNIVVEEPIAAPTASALDADAKAETKEPTVQTDAAPVEAAAADVSAPEESAPEDPATAPSEAPSAREDVAEATAETATEQPAPVETAGETITDAPQPEVATAVAAPEAPEVLAPAPAEAIASAEVPKPETLSEPSKPAETVADAPALAPEAPPETAMAEVAPEPALPEPAVETAPAEPAVAIVKPEPAAEPAPAAAPATAAAPTEPSPETPATASAETAPAPAAEPAAADEIVVAEASPEAEVPVAETPAVEAPAVDPVPEAATTETIPADPAPAEVPAPDASASPETPAPAKPAPETADSDAAPDAGAPAMPGTRPDALADPQDPATAAATAEKGSTFKPAPGLPRAGEGAITGRDDPAEPAPADPAADPAAPVDERPLVQFAATFENPEGKPPFAVVLIDDGSAGLDRASLAALPFPVSFALNPLDPASAQHAATYRAAGKEVVMLVTGIAEGAIPADVEVAFQSMEQGLPEAVAVMDLPVPSFQNRRPLAATVVPILKAQGRGLLTWDAGLNAADQVARREDLAAGVIFRDIGSTGTDDAAIRRLLDRAVFKAVQEGRVSVVGNADPATVAALLEWTVEGKSATVALAPVTAVLTVE